MIRLLAVLVVCLGGTGCVSMKQEQVRTEVQYAAVNERLAGHPATLLLHDGSVSHGHHIQLRADSTFWTEQGTAQPRAEATPAVYAIDAAVFRKPVVSRWGFALGLVAWSGLVVLSGATTSRSTQLSTGGLVLGGSSALVAGLLGAFVAPHPQDDEAVGRFILHERFD